MINFWGWVLGGLLIGYGGSLAKGDISYHYYSGIPKSSMNSIVFLFISIVSAGLLALYKTFYPILNHGQKWSDNTVSTS